MKTLVTATSILTLMLAVLLGEASAGVSVSIGEPGFYGQIDIGNYPQPRLIRSEPIIVRRGAAWGPPIYLRVPPAHIRYWNRHCNAYNACGRPVYFVEDAWYQDVYVPRYREHHRVVAPPPPPRPGYYDHRNAPPPPGPGHYDHRNPPPPPPSQPPPPYGRR